MDRVDGLSEAHDSQYDVQYGRTGPGKQETRPAHSKLVLVSNERLSLENTVFFRLGNPGSGGGFVFVFPFSSFFPMLPGRSNFSYFVPGLLEGEQALSENFQSAQQIAKAGLWGKEARRVWC